MAERERELLRLCSRLCRTQPHCLGLDTLHNWLIGAHELEAHHAFDIWYGHPSDIAPTAITGGMHSLSKVNFAIPDWFGPRDESRFTDLDTEISNQRARLIANAIVYYNSAIAVAPADQVQGRRERDGAGAHHIDLALVAHER